MTVKGGATCRNVKQNFRKQLLQKKKKEKKNSAIAKQKTQRIASIEDNSKTREAAVHGNKLLQKILLKEGHEKTQNNGGRDWIGQLQPNSTQKPQERKVLETKLLQKVALEEELRSRKTQQLDRRSRFHWITSTESNSKTSGNKTLFELLE